MLDRVLPAVPTTQPPDPNPSPALPKTLLDDTHIVPHPPLRHTRSRALKFPAPIDTTATVKLTDPVTAAFVPPMLLKASEAPAKLNPPVRLPTNRPEVAPVAIPDSLPIPDLVLTLLPDVHSVPHPLVLPGRVLSLFPTTPIDCTATVKLTDPVDGPLQIPRLLNAIDTPPKLTDPLRLDRTLTTVGTTDIPDSYPGPNFPFTLLQDTHPEDKRELSPTRHRGHTSTPLHAIIIIVKLTLPEVGEFRLTMLLMLIESES